MELYTVGAPFPDNRYKGSSDCAVVSFQDTSFDCIVLVNRPSPAEFAAFSAGAFNYGLYREDNIPFLTLEFKTMGFDASFNILKIGKENLKPWLDSEHNAMNIFLVESNSYQLLAIRSIGLHHAFMRELRDTLSAQHKQFRDMDAVDRQIDRINSRRSPLDMRAGAKKFRIG